MKIKKLLIAFLFIASINAIYSQVTVNIDQEIVPLKFTICQEF